VDVGQPVSSEELTVSELQQQMEEIQCEMEKRNERAAKYKRLYYDEKKKCEEVTAQLQMLLQVLSSSSSSSSSTNFITTQVLKKTSGPLAAVMYELC